MNLKLNKGVAVMASKIEQLIEDMVLDILTDEYELVDVEYVKEGSLKFLRIYIDKGGEMSLDDCQKLSRIISERLDEVDPIEENYMLEISSPGLDRHLKKEKDFTREKGKEVELKLFKAIEGVKEFEGTLLGLNENNEIEVEVNDQIMKFPKKEVAVIRLAIKI